MELPERQRAIATATDGNGDEKLGRTMAAIVRLRELRDQGFDHEEIARRVAVDHPRTPGGGAWSAATVDQVLRVADTSETEYRRSIDAEPAAGRSVSEHRPSHPSMPPRRPNRTPAMSSRPDLRRSIEPDLGIEPDMEPDIDIEPDLDIDPDIDSAGDRYPVAISSSRLGMAIGLLAVLALAGAAYYFLSYSSDQTSTESAGTGRPVSDEERTAASQTLLSEVANGAPVSDESPMPGEQSVDSTTIGGHTTEPADGGATPDNQPPVIVDIDDLPQGDPADMLTIRVEGDDNDSDDEGGGSGLSSATATIRTDGKLHVEGVFPTAAAADAFVAQAIRVFGPEALVESYTVDPAAPRPTVSDVALDKPVLFESGSAQIHPDYIPFLEACAGVLKANPHIVMSVSGYTDSLGNEQFNLELSQQRARAIVDFYRDLEIAEAQLVGTGFGEDSPVADNTSALGREKNRRAMLQLLNIMDEG